MMIRDNFLSIEQKNRVETIELNATCLPTRPHKKHEAINIVGRRSMRL